MNRDVRNLQKLMESGGLAFNSGPHWGDFADYPQSNVTVLKPSEKDEEEDDPKSIIYSFIDSELKKAKGYLTTGKHGSIPDFKANVIDSINRALAPFSDVITDMNLESEISDYIEKSINMLTGRRIQNPMR